MSGTITKPVLLNENRVTKTFTDFLATGEYLRNVSTDPLPKIDDCGGVPGTCGRILAQFLLSLS